MNTFLTLFFFIQGNQSYWGQTTSHEVVQMEGSKAVFENQSGAFNKTILELAQGDSRNQYIIVYSHDGTTDLKFIRQGKVVQEENLPNFIYDSQNVAELTRKIPSHESEGQKVFYYYGENFARHSNRYFDLNHTEKSFGFSDMNQILDTLTGSLGKFDLGIFHTCLLDNAAFVTEVLKPHFQSTIIPNGPILNSSPDLSSMIAANTVTAMTDAFVEKNDKAVYAQSWISCNSDCMDFFEFASALSKFDPDQSIHKRLDRLRNQLILEPSSRVDVELLSNRFVANPVTGEFFISFKDYLALLNRETTDPQFDQALEELKEKVQHQPKLLDTHWLIPLNQPEPQIQERLEENAQKVLKKYLSEKP